MLNDVVTNESFGIMKHVMPKDVYIVSPCIKKHPESGKKYMDDASYQPIMALLQKDDQFDSETNLIEEDNFKNVPKIIQSNGDTNTYLALKEIQNYTLFILDDCIGKIDFDQRNSYLSNLSTGNRHDNLCIIIVSQDYLGISKRIRRNATNISVFSLDQADDIKILANEKRGKISKDDFIDMYWYCCDKLYGFMHIKKFQGKNHYFNCLKEEITP